MPHFESYYASPLSRCTITANLTFADIQLPAAHPFVPTVKEGFREGMTPQTCNRRSSKVIPLTLAAHSYIWLIVGPLPILDLHLPTVPLLPLRGRLHRERRALARLRQRDDQGLCRPCQGSPRRRLLHRQELLDQHHCAFGRGHPTFGRPAPPRLQPLHGPDHSRPGQGRGHRPAAHSGLRVA